LVGSIGLFRPFSKDDKENAQARQIRTYALLQLDLGILFCGAKDVARMRWL
jgi:hypothetical protein